MTEEYNFLLRIAKVCIQFPWYDEVYRWYCNGMCDEKEIIDGLEYLEKRDP